MFHYIIISYIFVLAFLSLQSFSLVLHLPTTPIAYGLYFNLTWTSKGGDPAAITITSTNLITTRSFSLADVNVSDGNLYTRIIPDTPASLPGLYSLQAVDSSNTAHILDVAPPFNLSTVPTSVLLTEHERSHSSSGAIIGGVLGSLAGVALLATGFFIHRRLHRHNRNRSLSFRLPDYGGRLPAQTQQEWETQVHNAMAEAQRRSNKIGVQQGSKAHNRLGSMTNTASVTSDDI